MFGGFLSGYNLVKDYLYNSENWSELQYKWTSTLYGVNIMGFAPWKGAIDSIYNARENDEYRRRYGITGGGHDFRNLPGTAHGGSTGMFGSVNFVSKNLGRLYR